MASTEKSRFNQFQSLVTILTPVVVAIGGFYGYVLQKEVADAEAKAAAAETRISEIETSIRNVEAMETYFKMMGVNLRSDYPSKKNNYKQGGHSEA